VRQDLWNAVLNYSAGHAWVWDGSAGRARASNGADNPAPLLPTVTRDDLASLRASFAQNVEFAEDDRASERLERWREKGLGTAALPLVLQGQWNEFLKSAVVDRLTAWFSQNGIAPPDDLLYVEEAAVPRASDQELVTLRNLVIDCIRSMTLSELAALQLPAGAVLRAQTHRTRG
jgi:hypothetical protein